MVDYADETVPNKPLYGMFTAIPGCYDLVNRVITWGLDKRWRVQAARECLAAQPSRVLDLGCGTGDLAINVARLAGSGVEVIGLDFSRPMLEIAARKAELLAKGSRISFTCGDAANLPAADGYFDCVGISFAFRNLTYKNPLAQRHVAEVVRVLNPGGRLVIVETSQPKVKLIRKLFHLYLGWFVSGIGYLLSGHRGAYHYLAESAARFYTTEELKEVLVTAGFSRVTCHPLLFGAAGIYVAVK
ncbi:MAG: ubiquinone/menaquinone biosynthesis methyltransferase [Dehalococcoidales bacterium]|nr:ubiquinone/menaquinone biosynthesis methyltransferase [Dehalococcoidales bacterium]